MSQLKLIKKLCSFDVNKLKHILIKYLKSKNYKHIIKSKNYIIAEGDIPICLIAHMDTVFSKPPTEFYYDIQKQVLWSPTGAGFDDRIGIYIIIQILECGYKPTIIFTDGEEAGCIGSSEIVKKYPNYPFVECKALIQLDRANEKDAVYYNCDNQDFENYISSFGFETDFGSFSDISVLAPAWEIAAVNLSVGYIAEHTISERLYCNWCNETIEKVKRILNNANNMPSFAYIPFEVKWHDINLNISIPQKCLICGGNSNDGKYIQDTAYPYFVCNKCYTDYYENYNLN